MGLESIRNSEERTRPMAVFSKPEEDATVMRKIWSIVGRGNNAEVKKNKDGTLAVMEVKKHIV